MIGQLVDGKYEVTRLLGEGGMGAVYEAIHTGTGRRVALKVIISADLAKSRDLVGRFEREARAAGSIDTQHIVQVLDTGTDRASGYPFLVMELLSGGDLSQLLQRLGPLPPELALRIVAQACIGLEKAHDAGVIHRDIKPANLFLARRDGGEIVVKVLDFGIAKVSVDAMQDQQNHHLTRTGSMLGSPAYMSPEQAKGLKTIDNRSDLWSLGAVLYEALTGRTPHHDVETLGQLIIAICADPPPPLQNFAPWVAPEKAAIAHTALRIDPTRRYASASAMLEALRKLLPQGWAISESMLVPLDAVERACVAPRLDGQTGVGASTHVHAKTAPERFETLSGAGTSQETRARPARSSMLRAGVAVGAVLGTLAAGAYGYQQLAAAPPPPPAPAETAVAVPPPTPATVPEPPSTPTVTPADAGKRTVRLVVVPATATVEVDGTAVQNQGGFVEFAGALGSLHTVKVAAGGRNTTGEVVITEAGAVPPKLEVGVPVQKVAVKPTPSAPAAKTTPAAPAEPKRPQIDKTFE